MEKKQLLSKKDKMNSFIRSNFLGAAHNYERMQALGSYFAMIPTFKKLYKDRPKEERADAIKRHLQFFNTNPYVFGPVLGTTMAMEENTEESEKESVITVRTGLMGPLAGLGDSLLALTVVPIILSIGSALALEGSILGPILYFVLFSVIIWPIKYYGFRLGYEQGSEILSDSKGTDIIERVSRMGNVVGMMVAVSLIVNTVEMDIPIEYTVGDGTFEIQEMLDDIVPNLLPVLLTLGIFRLLKNKDGKNVVPIIIGITIGGILLSVLGILG